jgi:hypothetical protein
VRDEFLDLVEVGLVLNFSRNVGSVVGVWRIEMMCCIKSTLRIKGISIRGL